MKHKLLKCSVCRIRIRPFNGQKILWVSSQNLFRRCSMPRIMIIEIHMYLSCSIPSSLTSSLRPRIYKHAPITRFITLLMKLKCSYTGRQSIKIPVAVSSIRIWHHSSVMRTLNSRLWLRESNSILFKRTMKQISISISQMTIS